MIGRQEQLTAILSTIDGVLSGAATPSVLFITGEAGIGKTTLLHEVLAALHGADAPATRRQCTVAVAQCSTPLAGRDIGEVESLQPWAELMARLLELSARDVVEKKKPKFDFAKFLVDTAPAWVTMVPVLGPSVGAAFEIVGATYDQFYFHKKMAKQGESRQAAGQQQVFQQFVNVLAQSAAQQPLVLAIDDFHWADTSSANLLFTAARELRGRPVVFLIAYRPDDAAGSRGGEGHPVLHIRNELMRYDLATDVAVPRFTSGDLDALLRARYTNYHNNDRFEEWLAHAGSGNALFITQFLRTLEEDGYIDAAGGVIREGYTAVRVPVSAQAVVQERIRRLNEDTREMLRYASVEGDIFTATVLAQLTETPQLRLLQRLRIAEETHQFVRSLGKQRVYARETTTYRFTHALLHKVLYESLGEEERELLHEAVLTTLMEEWTSAVEQRVNIEGFAVRLAVHAEILGRHLVAAEALLRGAQAAWEEYAQEETLQLLERMMAALDRIRTDDPDTRHRVLSLRAEALLLRAAVHKLVGRYDPALDDVRAAEPYARECSSRLFIDVLTQQAFLQRLRNAMATAKELSHTALHLAEQEHYSKGIVNALTSLANVLTDEGEYAEALVLYERALAIAQQEGQTDWEASALDNIGIVSSDLGDYGRAKECYDRSLELLTAIDDRNGIADVLTNLGTLYYHTGEYEQAQRCFERSADISRSIGDIHNEANTINNIGALKFQKQEFEEALHCYRRSLDLHTRFGYRRGQAAARDNIGQALQGLGRYDEALACHLEAAAEQEALGDRYSRSITLYNIGVLYRRTHRLADSAHTLEEALTTARAIGARDLEAAILEECARTRLAMAHTAEAGHRAACTAEAIALLESSIALFRQLGRREAEHLAEELKTIRESA